jgi:DNA-binding transcriptional LysR family regulator
MACRLIDRTSNHFRVTPAGERLYAECRRLFAIVSDLPGLVGDRTEEITGPIEMAFTSHVECPFLDRFLADFQADHPGVSYATTVTSSQQVTADVLAQKVSLGICLAQEKDASLAYCVLYREHFGYFCAPGHPLYGRSDLTLDALRQLDYVTFKTDRIGDALSPIALLRQQAGFEGRLLGVSPSLEEVKRLIKIGSAFGPLPVHVVADEIASQQLWQLPPYNSLPAVDVHLVYRPDARRSRAERAFLTGLIAAINAVPLSERTYPQEAAHPGNAA